MTEVKAPHAEQQVTAEDYIEHGLIALEKIQRDMREAQQLLGDMIGYVTEHLDFLQEELEKFNKQ